MGKIRKTGNMKEYMKAYNALYSKRHRPTTTEIFMPDRFNHSDLCTLPTSINFKGSDPDEPLVCSHFGCRTHLTPEQQLYGTKCIHCQENTEINPTAFASHPIKQSA